MGSRLAVSLKARQRRRWLAACGWAVVFAGAATSCGKAEPARGGLMLMVSSDGPLELDRLEIEISSNGKSLLANEYRVPEEVTLPTTLAIVSNDDPTAQATISVTGWLARVPLDRRDAIVSQVPTDRLAALKVVLSARCSDKLSINAKGEVVSSCGEGNTCDNHGRCGAATVEGESLPDYHNGDESDAGLGGGGFGGSPSGGDGGLGGGLSGRPDEGDAGQGGGGAAGRPDVGSMPTDPCAEVVCDAPPMNDCISATRFKSYEKSGTCSEGECSYQSQVVACDCVNHVCANDPCASLACINMVCVDGACQGDCAPPQTVCNGTTPQFCTSLGAWKDEPVTAGKCDAACTPKTTQCSGLTAQQTCKEDGSWSAAVACVDQTCVGTGVGSSCTGQCAQGQTQCSGSDVQACAVTGKWDAAKACPAPQTCQNDACACPASAPNLCNDNCTNYQNDKFNCGSCGHSCQGGACSAGVCQPFTLFTTGGTPVNIAVSSTNVYWTDSSSSVSSLPLGGGAFPGSVSFGGSCGIMGLTLDSTRIYGIARTNCSLGGGSLMAAPLAGGSATKLNTDGLGAGYPTEAWRCLAVDATNVYITNFDTNDIFKVPKAGGSTVKLTTSSGWPYGIVVQGANVYWGTPGGVVKFPIAGGSQVSISDKADGGYLAIDSSYVYYTAGGAVMKALLTGSTPVTLVASGAANAVAIDTNNVYYLGASTVMTVPKTGGSARTLASGQTSPRDIAVDATSVYWVTSTTIMKRAL